MAGGQTGRIRGIAYDPDGGLLASGSGAGAVQMWDANSGELSRTLLGHSEGVRSVAFSPGVEVLASGGRDGTIRLWDRETGKQLRTLTVLELVSVEAIAFSPHGQLLASGGPFDSYPALLA